MKVRTFGFDDHALRARYDRLFEATASAFIQQSTYWADAVCAVGSDTPVFLLCESEDEDVAGLPLYLFEHPCGNVLTSVPSLGPLGGVFVSDRITGARKQAAYQSLIARAIELAREHECVALSLITNPFDPDVEIYRDALHPTIELENFTQFVPLRSVVPTDNRYVSRNLRRAHAAGFTLSDCGSDEELEEFHGLVDRRYKELGVAPPSLAFMQAVRRHLEPRGKWRLILVRKDGALVAGAHTVRHHRVMDSFQQGVDSTYRQQSPNFLAVERTLADAVSHGVEIFNWQSSPSRRSGVYAFKQQWGSVDRPYFFLSRLFRSVDHIRRIGLAKLQQDYAWHFVVPYRAFDDGFAGTSYAKDQPGIT
jgi:hypothetical protein